MSLDFILKCKCCGSHIFEANITHNLNTMADKAGIYEALWRPEEINANLGEDIIEILEKGLKSLKAKPKYYKKFDSAIGWGVYEHFIPFVEAVLVACKKFPKAEIWISR